jgi:hypothetical protein
MRSMVEGASAVEILLAATESSSSPAPLPPRFARSPLPAFAGRDEGCVRIARTNFFSASPRVRGEAERSEGDGPLSDSERCNSEPSGEAPSSRPYPRTRGVGV